MFQEGTAAPDRHRGIPDAVDRLPVLEPAAVAGKASPVPSQLPVHKPESSSLVPMLEGGGAQCWPQEFSGGPEVQGLFVSRQHCFLNAQGFLI